MKGPNREGPNRRAAKLDHFATSIGFKFKNKKGVFMLSPAPQVLVQGNVLTASAFAQPINSSGFDPNTALSWTVDSPVVAVSPVTNSSNCQFTFLGVGSCNVTCTGKSTAGTLITGTFQIQTQLAPPPVSTSIGFTFTNTPLS